MGMQKLWQQTDYQLPTSDNRTNRYPSRLSAVMIRSVASTVPQRFAFSFSAFPSWRTIIEPGFTFRNTVLVILSGFCVVQSQLHTLQLICVRLPFASTHATGRNLVNTGARKTSSPVTPICRRRLSVRSISCWTDFGGRKPNSGWL